MGLRCYQKPVGASLKGRPYDEHRDAERAQGTPCSLEWCPLRVCRPGLQGKGGDAARSLAMRAHCHLDSAGRPPLTRGAVNSDTVLSQPPVPLSHSPIATALYSPFTWTESP